jgi:hypothetical protein
VTVHVALLHNNRLRSEAFAVSGEVLGLRCHWHAGSVADQLYEAGSSESGYADSVARPATIDAHRSRSAPSVFESSNCERMFLFNSRADCRPFRRSPARVEGGNAAKGRNLLENSRAPGFLFGIALTR